MQKNGDRRVKMTPLDMLPADAKYMIMMLAGTALMALISTTAGRMALEIIHCNKQGKSQTSESE